MVRLKALEAIQEFAKETDQDRVGERRRCNKAEYELLYDTSLTKYLDPLQEAVSQGDTIRTIVKFIDCEDCQERELAVSALCDLSKSEVVCGKISELNGAVLILGKVAGSKADNPTIAEQAEMTLQNLDRCEKNAVHMAENGRLEPLLNLLIEGSSLFLFLMVLYKYLVIC